MAYYYRGESRRRFGDIDAGLSDFEYAIKLNPKSPVGYLGRGLVCVAKGEFEKAISDFTTVIDLDARIANAYANRGFVYRALGKDTEAETDFARAIELDPLLEAEIKVAKIKIHALDQHGVKPL
jgi:tetratricopeptide (TPR) repeat protein